MQKSEDSFVTLSQGLLNICHLTATHHRHNKRSVTFLQQLSSFIYLSHVSDSSFPSPCFTDRRENSQRETQKEISLIFACLSKYSRPLLDHCTTDTVKLCVHACNVVTRYPSNYKVAQCTMRPVKPAFINSQPKELSSMKGSTLLVSACYVI